MIDWAEILAVSSAFFIFIGLAPSSSGRAVMIAWADAFCFSIAALFALLAIILAIRGR